MPTEPDGEKRPADVVANTVLSMEIATGEPNKAYASNTRNGELKGGKKPAESLVTIWTQKEDERPT